MSEKDEISVSDQTAEVDQDEGIEYEKFERPLSAVDLTGRRKTTKFCVGRRSVADEVETSDLLHRKPEKIDVGSLAERRFSPISCPTI
ncbi:hypothetical protein PSH89_13700 [Pseudomonas sp. FP1911]|mgnify:CR=1 FL=1|uniref:Uncharacterized protein n=1 Tax=Pseudomonas poae TaxID=200451 RepID=A0AAP2WLH6_9PSED|nr:MULTISPECIES: hypothetical protein [Pseudomonas]MCF5657934.1 hypothetical protein [Pseudomonas poae]MDH0796347.1 hypothetical protein [Pseudomonas carnis]WLG82304.1 hypothetical protein PSH89_13700 [Pseudomonas sp. FP1911]